MMAKLSSSSLAHDNCELAKVTRDTLQVRESVTSPAGKVKDLECWFDRHLKMDMHINNICMATFFHLFNIRRNRKFLCMECTKISVNALVTSRLDCCNSLLLYGFNLTTRLAQTPRFL